MVDIKLTHEEIQDIEQEQFKKINVMRIAAGDKEAINYSMFTMEQVKMYEELVDYHLNLEEKKKITKYEPVYLKAFKRVAGEHKYKRGFLPAGIEELSAERLQMYDDLVRVGLERLER